MCACSSLTTSRTNSSLCTTFIRLSSSLGSDSCQLLSAPQSTTVSGTGSVTRSGSATPSTTGSPIRLGGSVDHGISKTVAIALGLGLGGPLVLGLVGFVVWKARELCRDPKQTPKVTPSHLTLISASPTVGSPDSVQSKGRGVTVNPHFRSGVHVEARAEAV